MARSTSKQNASHVTLLSKENAFTRLLNSPYFFPTLCIATLLLGLAFRLYYTHLTAYNISVHDLGSPAGLTSDKIKAGHLGYVEYIAKKEMLPNFDPRKYWSYYNPPFFHICAAILLRFFVGLGIPEAESWELLQYFSCAVIFAATVGMYKILKQFDIKGLPLWLGTVLISFHPTLTYLSLTLNNDPLSLMLTVWAVYFAVKWYKKPTTSSILAIALCVGLGMLTKLTVALIAPPIALLFIVRFFKDKQYVPHLKQFGVFSAVCFPLGLFWSVRNMWLYDIELTYVQSLPVTTGQYVGDYSTWQRFGIPQFSDFTRVDSSWTKGSADHNLWSQTLRTSLFDDNMLKWADGAAPYQTWASVLMVISVLLFVLLSLVTVVALFKAKQVSPLLRGFVGLALVLIVVNFVKFCIDYPFTCTIHFRYIAPVLLYGCIGLGMYWAWCKKGILDRILMGVTATGMVSTAILSTVLYVNCLPPLVVA